MYVLGYGIASKSVGGGGQEEEREIANSLLITTTEGLKPAEKSQEP
jgi:hypothetical protein